MFYAGISLLSPCTKPASVRLLTRLRRITFTSTGSGFSCTVPPSHQPTASRRRGARWSGEVGELSCTYAFAYQGAELCGAQASGRGAIPPHVISLLDPLPLPTREAGREPRAAPRFSQHGAGPPKYDALSRSLRMVWFEEELHRPLSRTAYGARNQIGRRPYCPSAYRQDRSYHQS
jgi:hypothetical protein